ncbi:hypothetical protein ACR6C2_08215 [Streptomyces sp. INA 01156]
MHALKAAHACRFTIPEDVLPKASTSVLFFHHRSSLQRAVVEAQRLLAEAKERVNGKNALAVGYVRRSGTRDESVQAWSRRSDNRSPVDDFTEFLMTRHDRQPGPGADRGLSLRIVHDCLRDERELVSLPDDVFAAEMRRLVARHNGTPAQADALIRLSAAAVGAKADGGSGKDEAGRQLAVR